MDPFSKSIILLYVLLNPFLLTVYLLDLIRNLSLQRFSTVIFRAALISATVFFLFSMIGEGFFNNVLQARFASFLIFGGVVFFIISVLFIFMGPQAINTLRAGNPQHIEGSIAMPFMIGPGTINASVYAGSHLSNLQALVAIFFAMALVAVSLIVLKFVFDHLHKRYAPLVERYVDVVGRLMSLIIGTISVEMIVQGVEKLITPAI